MYYNIILFDYYVYMVHFLLNTAMNLQAA